ncbi:hypothetical protein [Shewanella sp. NFH-SH190041]|uniref:hypothetical protein n=1 Tax=Shewanella sp. NFH-SH190041 TaxID=2950245 RepID=UPI0021C3862C|nr:hypothetical protein [Shewanella sp. NFH-SH190041]
MKTNPKKTLAHNLSNLMHQNDMRQPDVERASQRHGGVNQKTISNYLAMAKEENACNPTLEKIAILAAVFNLQACELLDPTLGNPKSEKLDAEKMLTALNEGISLMFEAGILTDENAHQMIGVMPELAKISTLFYNSTPESRQALRDAAVIFIDKKAV